MKLNTFGFNSSLELLECSLVCHPKCVPSVPDTCGLPTEYVRHFSSMMEKHGTPGKHTSTSALKGGGDGDDMIKMQGWIKIRK